MTSDRRIGSVTSPYRLCVPAKDLGRYLVLPALASTFIGLADLLTTGFDGDAPRPLTLRWLVGGRRRYFLPRNLHWQAQSHRKDSWQSRLRAEKIMRRSNATPPSSSLIATLPFAPIQVQRDLPSACSEPVRVSTCHATFLFALG